MKRLINFLFPDPNPEATRRILACVSLMDELILKNVQMIEESAL